MGRIPPPLGVTLAELARTIGIEMGTHPKIIDHVYAPEFDICREFPSNCMAAGGCHFILNPHTYEPTWHFCGEPKEVHVWIEKQSDKSRSRLMISVWRFLKRLISFR